uniref:GDSL esterase/lipase n=1 Tax=Aegilops tauschii subsp. strangulata TaxID=200361 RepID=A0A453AXW1_AEGTS
MWAHDTYQTYITYSSLSSELRPARSLEFLPVGVDLIPTMAGVVTTTLPLRLVVAVLLAFLATTASASAPAKSNMSSSSSCRRLFSFGDSLIDTGNFIHYSKAPGSVSRSPYGETFFGRPNGRWSDGR